VLQPPARRHGTNFVSLPVHILGVIPARLGSSRLPRKPLLPLAGEPLILWVVRRVVDAGVCDRVVVATDAREIAAVVERAGYEAALTSERPESGTERVAEVIRQDTFREFDWILNVQGDEPLVPVEALRGALACLERGEPIGTAAGTLDRRLVADPNRVKVVVSPAGRAVYFSRAPIPFDRDGTGTAVSHQHVGVYAYTRAALEQWMRLPPVSEERWERLEQLRPLLHGVAIGVTLFDAPVTPGVDTAEDLRSVETILARQLREV
jgi:3-deoxy-manno-octulosonate cytidylyltransferase (CMP-KDO synthetase)